MNNSPIEQFDFSLTEAILKFRPLYDSVRRSETANAATKTQTREVMEALVKMHQMLGSLEKYCAGVFNMETENELLKIKIAHQEKLLFLYDVATEKHGFEKLSEMFSSQQADEIIHTDLHKILNRISEQKR